ncbi:hypothetical protein [Pseudonocardia alni]|uniref:hypothetical protein n=1 Tax=Pseudonocardia alni TaxID=33907 RepID=UPI003318DCBA
MILAAEAATSATTPLWVTVLLAVLTPTLTLVGVLWTQRAADRRADRDAERRIEHERERALVERVHVLYADLLRKAMELLESASEGTGTFDRTYIDFVALQMQAQALGELSVASTARVFFSKANELDEARRSVDHGKLSPAWEAALDSAVDHQDDLIEAIRRELAVRPTRPAR